MAIRNPLKIFGKLKCWWKPEPKASPEILASYLDTKQALDQARIAILIRNENSKTEAVIHDRIRSAHDPRSS